MDSLALVNLLPLMKRTSGKSEIVIGWIDGPILAESYPERESTCNKTKTLVNMKRITKSVKFPWLGSQIATLPLALLASIANAWALPLNTAYVANSGDSTVSVIALDTLTVVATIHVGSTPTYLAVLPDGSRVYVANRDSNDLSVINTSSGLVIKTIAVGTAPARLAVSRDGQHVYVPNSGSSDISVIETAANAVIATVPTPPEPTAIAFHPARDETWIGYGQIGTVIEVRSALDYSVLASLTSFSRLYGSGFAFRPDGSEVFAAESCGFCGRFHLLSGTPSGGSITIIQPDILFDNTGSAAGMAINPSSGIAYLAKTGQNGTPYIREFGGAGRTLTFSTPPGELAIAPDGERLYVVHFLQGFISVVDTLTLSPISTVNVGTLPDGIALVTLPQANQPPVAKCKNVTVPADSNCSANASVDDGSFDPDGDSITLAQSPAGPYPLGQTAVTLTVTDSKGASNSCTATVTVEDAVAPVATCVPGPNPSGRNIPNAGGISESGSDPSGFFELIATDNCDSTPQIFIQDSASDFVAGPFSSGDKVKITQAPGVPPNREPMAGVIVAHIQLRGDALIYGVDAAGNKSEPHSCLVPSKTK